MQQREPHALVIEDSPTHAIIAEVLLKEVGFEVELVDSLAAGFERAQILLDPAGPDIPLLLLLDLKLPHPLVASLEGSLLAARVGEAMQTGALRPAHMVAITSEPAEERCQEALLAGCERVIEKPLQLRQAIELRKLVDTPPVLARPRDSADDRALRLLRRSAAQLLPLIQQSAGGGEAPVSLEWDEERARQLLFAPTTLLREEPWRSWLRQHGGVEAVLQRLRATPLHETQRVLLGQIIDNPSHWQTYTRALNIGRATYFRRLSALLVELASALNEW